ncbi:MAG: chemotaxis protein CheD [Candidatus Hodarchaeales archaeon]|jgi:chemotaxis protein CheD
MSKEVLVGMGQIKTAKSPVVLRALALGSCVGIALWDEKEKVGSLAHAILPDMPANRPNPRPHRYATTAVDIMLEEMRQLGATTSEEKMTAKLVGGANMFPTLTTVNVGARNVEAAKTRLKELGFKLAAEATGKTFGRTLSFFLENGKIEITIAGGKLWKKL